MTPTLAYPQPHNDESSMALHTHFGGCVAILGPFSLHETNPKNAQTTSTAKYGSAQPPKTPTRTLYDNETSTAPHTCFGGPGSGPNTGVCSPQTAQPSSTCNLHDDESNTVPDARFSGCLARLGSFSLHQTRQGQNTGARAATQDPNLQLPTIYMNQTRCHTPAEVAQALSAWPPNTTINQTSYHTPTSAGVITSGLPSLTLSESQDPTRGPSPQTPTTDMTMDKTWHHTPAAAATNAQKEQQSLLFFQHMKPYCREPKSTNPPGSPAREYAQPRK
ncbi:hypothetical protein BS47DRAFT_1369660 [Hydnum rufescens UP504]|uniref:Uncharacterized protein n=1 Tax=Hydnum rufescens UP504 TaxID=1448309 RepID=A0A9P6DLP6_9AGAM|nr:hypothetical protein BS47DRAFT_1369660 [Hydnum rufescens UP504]